MGAQVGRGSGEPTSTPFHQVVPLAMTKARAVSTRDREKLFGFDGSSRSGPGSPGWLLAEAMLDCFVITFD